MTTSWHFPYPIVGSFQGMQRGTRIFRLHETFLFRSSIGSIYLPEDFDSDGLSTPKFTWPWIAPFSQGFPAALVHDYLYTREGSTRYKTTRKQADDLFLEALYHCQLDYRRNIMHATVRAFGWRSYQKR
jgi:hypothetical protein